METQEVTLLLSKPEVFIYNLPINIQRKTGYIHRAGDWDVSNPDSLLEVKIFVSDSSNVFVQLEDEDGIIFGKSSTIDVYPSHHLEPVVDSTRYFVVRIQTIAGANELFGMGFSSRDDSTEFTGVIQKYVSSPVTECEEAAAAAEETNVKVQKPIATVCPQKSNNARAHKSDGHGTKVSKVVGVKNKSNKKSSKRRRITPEHHHQNVSIVQIVQSIVQNFDVPLVESDDSPGVSLPTSSSSTESSKMKTILEKVMEYLPWADLRNCRLVDVTWSKISSQKMLKRDLCHIKLRYDETMHQYKQQTLWDEHCGSQQVNTLSDLISCIQQGKPQNFPCSSFSFQGGDLSTAGPQFFFNFFGAFIKTLGILRSSNARGGTRWLSGSSLRQLLLVQVANVEHLEISFFYYKLKSKQLISLPALKSLTCALPNKYHTKYDDVELRSTAFQLIQSSPNLKSVHNFKSKYIHRFIQREHSVDIIKSYNLEIFQVKKSQALKFARANLKLEKLAVSYQFSKKKPLALEQRETSIFVLNSIFESSQNSLKDLYMTPLCLLDPSGSKIKIPVLKNLKTLTLSRRWNETGPVGLIAPVFPKCINVQSTFPHLKIVNMFLSCDRDSAWQDYFPSGINEYFSTVEILRMRGFCTKFWFQNLHTLFPNVVTLTLISRHSKGWLNLDDVVQNICSIFSNLEQLELLGCGWCFDKNSVGTFDSALTGMSQDVCHRLSQSGDWTTTKELMDIKTHASIIDLEHLKRLKIRISNEQWTADQSSNFNLISLISVYYAFHLMSHLKVTVSYHKFCPSADEIASALDPIASFVNLIHEKHDE